MLPTQELELLRTNGTLVLERVGIANDMITIKLRVVAFEFVAEYKSLKR